MSRARRVPDVVKLLEEPGNEQFFPWLPSFTVDSKYWHDVEIHRGVGFLDGRNLYSSAQRGGC